ncbi:MAG: secretin N-terminal domain-containing protein [Candidatus Omnitrophica bacterium]|nr:secretin N-terminal domain-containing protein [Candidatus Omnitrophota bacterium]MDD5592869.1 secretin N-terminal domain-containing protein [Candidatus Omnitrophota bacterium]
MKKNRLFLYIRGNKTAPFMAWMEFGRSVFRSRKSRALVRGASFFLIFYLLSIESSATQEVADKGGIASAAGVTISMDFQDASLKDILKILSIQSGLNFIASEAVQDRKITLFLDKVPLEGVMDKLFTANNLSYELDNKSNIFLVKDWGKPQTETITKVFYLKYATVSSSSLKAEMSDQIGSSSSSGGTSSSSGSSSSGGSSSSSDGKWAVEEDVGITKAVKKNLSESGYVVEDYRTNSLIVTDLPSRIPVIDKVIASLDVPIPQVMLEVEMLDVSKASTEKLGLKFGQTPLTFVLTGAKRSTDFPFSSTVLPYAAAKQMTPGSMSFATAYQVTLDFLKTQTDTKFLARPRLLTLNNETAEIKITTQEAVGEILTVSGESGNLSTTTEAERYETGVSLRVTPQINLETGEITMFIVPAVAEATASGITSSSGVKFYNPETRTTKSIVCVKDNETVVLGGLIRNKRTQTITKLPFLGDLPFIGKLFTHKDVDPGQERELLVFITPHIVKDTSIEFASVKKIEPLNLKREQSIGSALNRQMTIDSSLNSLEK